MSIATHGVSAVRPDGDVLVLEVLRDAVDLARTALTDLGEVGVGAHLGVRAEDPFAATHRFEATMPGYRGWQWAVVLASDPVTGGVTVSESALLPGPDALAAPDWVPWDQRILPGDLAPGDLLAAPADDVRLVPAYTVGGDPETAEVASEIGLGRTAVLGPEGRTLATQRWYDGDFGPSSDMAKAAASTCGLCGFYLPLSGSLHGMFGVCANEMSADGHVVHVEYGCGAHSDTTLPTGAGSPIHDPFDDGALEIVELVRPVAVVRQEQETPADPAT